VTDPVLPFDSIQVDRHELLFVPGRVPRDPDGYARGAIWHQGKVTYDHRITLEWARGMVLHEAMHEMWKHSPLDDRFSVRTEEFIVNELAHWTRLVLKANPAFTDFVIDRQEG
jgi:hypothetical protein